MAEQMLVFSALIYYLEIFIMTTYRHYSKNKPIVQARNYFEGSTATFPFLFDEKREFFNIIEQCHHLQVNI